MKALIRSYVYWYAIDKEIKNLVKASKDCALVANPWPKTDKRGSSLHIDYAGPIKGTYNFIVVNSS